MKVGRPENRNLWRKVGFAVTGVIVAAGPQVAAWGAIKRFLERAAVPHEDALFGTILAVTLALNLSLLLEFMKVFKHREVPRPLRLALFYPYYSWWFGSALFAIFGGWAELATFPFMLAGLVEPLTGRVEAALAATAYLVGAYGIFMGTRSLRAVPIDVPLAKLPKAWEGAKIVQISDVHAGRYVGDLRVKQLAEAAAAQKPDLVVITGDLVNDSPTFAADAARALGAIPTKHGVFACLGNHDYYAGAEAVADAFAKAGIKLLRNDGTTIERGGERIYLAGVDEAWFHRTDLPQALSERPAGMATVLLSHHPELFPESASADVDLQLSGHTHGGQVGFLRLHPSLSLYRFISPFVAGLYRHDDALLYVNRGVGTVQPLIRLGAPPEITVLTLRAGNPSEARAVDYTPAVDADEAEEPVVEIA